MRQCDSIVHAPHKVRASVNGPSGSYRSNAVTTAVAVGELVTIIRDAKGVAIGARFNDGSSRYVWDDRTATVMTRRAQARTSARRGSSAPKAPKTVKHDLLSSPASADTSWREWQASALPKLSAEV